MVYGSTVPHWVTLSVGYDSQNQPGIWTSYNVVEPQNSPMGIDKCENIFPTPWLSRTRLPFCRKWHVTNVLPAWMVPEFGQKGMAGKVPRRARRIYWFHRMHGKRRNPRAEGANDTEEASVASFGLRLSKNPPNDPLYRELVMTSARLVRAALCERTFGNFSKFLRILVTKLGK